MGQATAKGDFEAHRSESGEIVCAMCGEDHPFDMPPELLKAALEGRLVIFAGAGISTESRRAVGDTFASRVVQELDDPDTAKLTFPSLMSEFERRFGRRHLLQRIRERFDYLKGFTELHRAATRFHRELATAYFLNEIVTTNWDTYFEELASATPIVIPEDYAFWDLPGRKVFKLHGSMHNLSTIVATEGDYAKCYKRLKTGALGSTFKHILATKRIVFVGYSFGDSDLAKILQFMKKELGGVLPQSFVVSPHGYSGTDFPAERVIATDGTYFIRRLKELAVERHAMRPDSVYDVVADLANSVAEARHKAVVSVRPKQHPAVIHTWAYQDGLLHALDRILALRTTGMYSDPSGLRGTLHSYEHGRRGAIALRNYFDAAYIEGYQNGLMSIEMDPDLAYHGTPRYFVWGNRDEMYTLSEYRTVLARAESLHKAAVKQAQALIRGAGGLDVVHTPFLDLPKLVAASQRGNEASRKASEQ
jgi:NAD-dependent SIR2 family protein deacetylase